MSTLAEIVHQYGAAYQEKIGDRLLPSHRRALRDIAQCRTVAFGGHVYHCGTCDESHYQYHSCQNRHCPQCQHNAAQQWLDKQEESLLPGPYFMVTFTLPANLRDVARCNQRAVYNLLFRTSAAALQELAQDPRYVGGQISLVGVLHTWGRNLCYHPHVHFLVPAGGLSTDGQQWLNARHNFLVPVKALSRLFRAKFRDALQETDFFDLVPAETWNSEWVVHCKPVGDGFPALKYLAPYIFRVAISNNRILKVTNGKVIFRYRASDTGRLRTCALVAEEFIRRFLQHVLPKGFVKVRYYGLSSPVQRHQLGVIRLWLDTSAPEAPPQDDVDDSVDSPDLTHSVRCPTCGQVMHLVQTIRPWSRQPP
ncbi:MAG: hypothetical protein AMJ56_16225 [Anaerolineae bacterium SG8_19]|nr:MAG: hypothetical protein AMJ56_16225 [Anaerolineae bacterium SG8_19]